MHNDEDFFDIDDEFESLNDENVVENVNDESDLDTEDFDFEDDEIISDEEIDEDVKTSKEIKKEFKKAKNVSDNYKRGKIEINDSVSELKGSIDSMLETLDNPNDMFIEQDLLPSLELTDVEVYDYVQEIELIKIDSKDTLESLANLYLDIEKMKNKNIYKIIKNDAEALADLNFSISMAKRALIGCMKQLDLGVNDPDMYQAVAMFQKEMRDTIKMTYDIQKKMKDFYKELKNELPEINGGEQEIQEEETIEDEYTIIGDPKLLNSVLEQYEKDPSLLNIKKDDKTKD